MESVNDNNTRKEINSKINSRRSTYDDINVSSSYIKEKPDFQEKKLVCLSQEYRQKKMFYYYQYRDIIYLVKQL